MPGKPRIRVRKGQGKKYIERSAFDERFKAEFYDSRFNPQRERIDQLAETAWRDYREGRKSPLTRPAGKGFADPTYDLSNEWRHAHQAVNRATRAHSERHRAARVLLICASARNDKTCPGEISKSHRLVEIAQHVFERHRIKVDVLDLSELTSDYKKVIYPCKGCVSTAMPLCHWPCSCYPNHSLGQVNDWMSDIYPRWVAAHGVMIVTPVYWYQAPSVLKLMMDRMVCADGGNPDPSSTHGKDPRAAKALELKGWDFPRHLEGRAFSLVVHGDSAGADILRRSLTDWLTDMHLLQAEGADSCIDRYIGYMDPYATSHDALDEDQALKQEVRNAAEALTVQIRRMRARSWRKPKLLKEPRPK